MTKDQREINAALERFGGQIAVAAIVMGRDIDEFTKQIKGCEELKLRWCNTGGPLREANTPPTQAETLHRPPLTPEELTADPSRDELELVRSYTQEDQLLSEGLSRLGLNEEEANIALELRRFYQTQFVSCVQILGGGMTRTCMKMQTQLDEAAKRLADVRAAMKADNIGPISRGALVDEERHLLDSYIRLADGIKKMFDSSQRAVMLQAMIRYKLGKHNDAPAKLPKPGFQPFIQVNGPTKETEEDTKEPNDSRSKRKSH
jgi:hypothetical protein